LQEQFRNGTFQFKEKPGVAGLLGGILFITLWIPATPFVFLLFSINERFGTLARLNHCDNDLAGTLVVIERDRKRVGLGDRYFFAL
jgi:hypothetical protein